MRKKMTLPAMADGDVTNLQAVSHPPANQQPENNDFHRSVERLGHTARATAQRLHAITYRQKSPSVITELVSEIFTLAALLSELKDDLLLESAIKAADQTPMWTSEHHKKLKDSVEECDDILRAVSRAVRKGFRIVVRSKNTKDYIEHFKLDDGPQALETVVRCSHLVSKTKVIVRHTVLSQTEDP
jgi:hypothetical protein